VKTTKGLTFNIKETAETLVPDKLGRVSYELSLGGIGVMAGMIIIGMSKLPAVVPLYFTLPWGEARLASKNMLYLLPTIGLIAGMINLSLGRITATISPLLPKVLAIGTAVITLMLMLALGGIFQSLIL